MISIKELENIDNGKKYKVLLELPMDIGWIDYINFIVEKGKEKLCFPMKHIKNENNKIYFETIVDYVILIVYLLKNIQATKPELNVFVNSFEMIINEVRKNIKISEYSKILHTDTRNKINLLKTYIKL